MTYGTYKWQLHAGPTTPPHSSPEADPGFRKNEWAQTNCDVTVMKSDVTIDFSVDVVRKNIARK